MAKHVVASASEIPDGGRLIVEVEGRSIGIFNVGGKFYALRNRCPHNGGPLCEGGPVYSLFESSRPGEYRVDPGRKFVTCPWHGWEYDLATGESWWDPVKSRVRSYPVSVVTGGEAAGGERVKGPYVAETYKAALEDAVVVIEVPD